MISNLAVIQNTIADEIGEREAFVWRDRRLTYGDVVSRARRFGSALRARGLGAVKPRAELEAWKSGQDHVALYLHNSNEYLEAMSGSLHARAVPFNVNYRYVEDELAYVLENGAARAVVFHSTFTPKIRAIRDRLPRVDLWIEVDDGSGEASLDGSIRWEDFLGEGTDRPLDLPYTADDLYMIYTGGTTGMPKGVLWRQEDVFFNGLGGHIPGFDRIDTEEKLRSHVQMGLGGKFLIVMPFMHGAGHWAAFNTWHRGGTVVLPDENRRLDVHSFWQAVERDRIESIGVIGDAFGLPLIAALREKTYDVSSVQVVMSTAAVLSANVKAELLSFLPETTMFIESIGSSESGLQGMSTAAGASASDDASYDLRDNTVILTPDRSTVLDPKAGADDGTIGWTASRGHLPLGYLEDPEKTRETFPTIDGTRYVITGDRVRYAPNGKLVFLGRESMCINTGGEKVYVEEVERVVKTHQAVLDCLVVGVEDDRWGQRVTAIISLRTGETAPSAEELRSHCRSSLADYKAPRAVLVAPEIGRLPNGKPDYTWAKSFAASA